MVRGRQWLGVWAIALGTVCLPVPRHAPGHAATVATPENSPVVPVAQAIPANTPFSVFINLSPAAWLELQRFGLIPPGGLAALQMVAPMVPENWQADRLAIAVLPATADTEPLAANLVAILPSIDAARTGAFLDNWQKRQGEPTRDRDYKGIRILEWTPSPADPAQPPEATVPSFLPPVLSFLPATPEDWQHALAGQTELAKKSPEMPPPPPTLPGPGLSRRRMAIAVLPDRLALATEAAALEKLIDLRTAGEALTTNPLFQRTQAHPQFARSLVVGYANLAEVVRLLPRLEWPRPPVPVPAPPIPFPKPDANALAALTETYNAADLFVWVAPEGIRTQNQTYYTTPQATHATPPTPEANQILRRLPAVTYLSANSRNFAQQWQQFTQSLAAKPESAQFLTQLKAGFQRMTGLDLEQDVMRWLDGEYAFFFYPTRGGLFTAFSPNLELGLGLVLQTRDRAAAEAAFQKLETRFLGPNFRVTRRQIRGQTVFSWDGRADGKPMSVLAYTWLDEETLLLTLGADAMRELVPQPYLPLDQNFVFQQATQSLPLPNAGYFYVNMGASLTLLFRLIRPDIPPAYAPLANRIQRAIANIRSISTTNSATAEAQRFDTLWVLSPRRD